MAFYLSLLLEAQVRQLPLHGDPDNPANQFARTIATNADVT
jgi:hypothetical protein